ncbi:MFS transporter [Deinococcus sp.]|uniref:MFS transporter n=1 Tax=Deinococcus sp. TaxID=47478 RepID=UPI003C7C9C2E
MTRPKSRQAQFRKAQAGPLQAGGRLSGSPQAEQSQATPPRLILYSLGFLAFFLFGLIQAGYGPAYPNLGREYGQSVTVVGTVASLHFTGSAIGTLLLGVLLTRLSLRSSLMAAALGLLSGLLGVALSPVWAGVLAGATLSGLAYGMLSAGFNLAFAELGAGPSNLVNGLFGVGSVVSPVLVTLLVRTSHAPPFLLMAGLAAGLALGVRLLWPRPVQPRPVQFRPGARPELEPERPVSADRPNSAAADLSSPPGLAPRLSRPIFTLFGLCFFLYVGIEAGFGNWATTYFTRLESARPALLTSFYWLALTAGRFTAAAVGSRFPAVQVLVFATVGTVLGSSVMLLSGLNLIASGLAPYGLVLAGFCVAPTFSTQLAWFTRSQPPRLAPYMLTLGSLGGALLPALTGLALPRIGLLSVPLVPLLIAVLLLLTVVLLTRRLKNADPRQATRHLS